MPSSDRDALSVALESVKRANSRLRVSQYLAQKALALEDQNEFWPLFAEHMTLFFSCDRVTIFQRTGPDRLVSRYALGLSAPLAVKIGEGITGHAASLQKPCLSNDPYQDPRFDPSIDGQTSYKTENLLAFPLAYQGRTVGVIDLLNKPGGFLDHDVSAMEDIGPQIAVILVKFDIEERHRELTRQMAQVEKMAAVGRLAAGVAHEINNPLSSILGFTQLLMRASKDPEALEDLKKIDAESQRIRTIVQNLLGFSRSSPGAFSTLSVPEVIDASLALVQHELRRRRLPVTKDYAEGIPAVIGDSNQLKQVFINLIMNALHATDGREGAALALKVLPREAGKSVEVEVRDNGAGIAAENLDKIFEPFFTTKPVGKGTGLGLYIVLGIIERHNGKISVDSAPGEGAAFKIVLPARAGA